MSDDDRMPDDPWRHGRGEAWAAITEAALLWSALEELPVEEARVAVGALDAGDLRGLVLEKLVCRRFRFELERDGSVRFERDHHPEPQRGVDEPEGGGR